VWGRQPLPAKRLVVSLACRLQDKPNAAESRGVGRQPHLRLKYPRGGLYSRNHPRVRERKAPGRAPADDAAGIAFSRAKLHGQRPQLLSYLGAHTNEHHFLITPGIQQAKSQRTTSRVSMPVVAYRLPDKPSAAESGGFGAAVPTCQALRCPR
jgi:hypothetical protein